MPAQKKIMFEFLREWTKSTAVKRQETLNAYLDGELAPQDRVAFERLLADDGALRQELADRELIKSQLRQLPRVVVPRNFILDASKYRKPAKRPLITYYPVLRGATALTAVIFIFTLGWGMMGSGESYSAAPAQEFAVEMVLEETAVEEEAAAEMVVEEAEMSEIEAVPAERTPADGIVEAQEAPAEAVDDAIEEFAEEAAGGVPAATSALAGAEEEPVIEDDTNAMEDALSAAPAAGAMGAGVDGEKMADEGMDFDVADDVMESAPVEEAIEMMETAVFTETAVVPTPTPPTPPEPAPSPALTSTQIAQIGLFILFITLLTLTFYARRQR